MRTALIPAGNGTRPVAEVILAGDGYEPPENFVAVASETANKGDLYDGSTFTPAPLPDLSVEEFAAFKQMLCERIDASAETIRLRSITPGSGQAMEYQTAQDEAKAALAALAADASADLNPLDYPMLAASIGSTLDPNTGKPSADIAGEARGIDAVRKAWVAGASALREIRLSGKKAVSVATTRADAQAAFDAVAWPKFV